MATATGQAPRTQTLFMVVPAVAAGSDETTTVGIAPFAGTLTACTYIADTAITGANTDSRTVSLINKGQAGSGTTAMATLAMTSGVNSTAFDEKTVTLSSTAADLDVAAGDVLAWKSLHVGSTGLADPGGTVKIVLTLA